MSVGLRIMTTCNRYRDHLQHWHCEAGGIQIREINTVPSSTPRYQQLRSHNDKIAGCGTTAVDKLGLVQFTSSWHGLRVLRR